MRLFRKPLMLRWETSRSIWSLSRVRFRLTPEWRRDVDMAHLWWLWFSLERLSKEWLRFCEDHGGGLESTMRWVEREIGGTL